MINIRWILENLWLWNFDKVNIFTHFSRATEHLLVYTCIRHESCLSVSAFSEATKSLPPKVLVSWNLGELKTWWSLIFHFFIFTDSRAIFRVLLCILIFTIIIFVHDFLSHQKSSWNFVSKPTFDQLFISMDFRLLFFFINISQNYVSKYTFDQLKT